MSAFLQLAADHGTDADLDILFVILAILGFGIALYMAYVNNYVGAAVALLVAVVILVVT